MVVYSDQKKREIREHMRDGQGHVIIDHIVEKPFLPDNYRLMAILTLEPGCSIGPHVHSGESETFHILEGTATMNDNGQETTLKPGDTCVTYDGQKHSVKNNANEPLKIMAVIITK